YDHPASIDGSYLVTRLSGSVRIWIPQFYSTRGGVTIFYDDLSPRWNNRRGFIIDVSVVDGIVLPGPTSCGGIIDMTESSPVMPIGSPFNDEDIDKLGLVSCFWRFFAPPGKEIEVTWRRVGVLNEEIGIFDDPRAVWGSDEIAEISSSSIDFDVAPFISTAGGLTVYLRGGHGVYIGDGFDADVRVTDPGFNNQSCGGTLYLTDDSPTISFSTPQYFTGGTGGTFRCRWYVNAPEGKQVRVTAEDIMTEYDEEIMFYDHPHSSDEDLMLSEIYGTIDSAYVVSTRGGISVVYEDWEDATFSLGARFFADVVGNTFWSHASNLKSCGRTIHLDDSTPSISFASPTYPETTQFNYFLCIWHFTSPPGTRLVFSLSYIYLGEDVTVYVWQDDFQYAYFNNNQAPRQASVEIDGNEAVVEFVADEIYDDVTQHGFLSYVLFVPEDAPTPAVEASEEVVHCGGLVTLTQSMQSLGIVTPFYPDYSAEDNIECTWVVRSEDGYIVSLDVADIDLGDNARNLQVDWGEGVRVPVIELAQPVSSVSNTMIISFVKSSDQPPFRGANFTVNAVFKDVTTAAPEPSTTMQEMPELTTEAVEQVSISDGVTVACDSMTLTVYLLKSVLPDMVNASDFHFIDDSCIAVDHDENQLMMSTRYDRCQTMMEQTNSAIIYSNKVRYLHIRPELDTEITRDMVDITVDVQCELERQQVLSRFFNPVSSAIEISEVGFGNFILSFDRYSDEQFDNNPEDPEAPILLGDRVFFGVTLTSVPELTVFIDNCWSTPSPDPLDSTQYTLITRGCAVDSTLEMSTDLRPKFEAFSLDGYSFVGNFSQVYVHCEVLVCFEDDGTSRCSQGCMTRSRRSAEALLGQSSTPRVVSRGPFHLADQEQAQYSMSTNTTILVGMVTGLVCLFLGAVITLIIVKFSRSS
ncbi:scavenger receptor cysteine-rich domain-containing protein DMBT1-like, partial [Diadema antillarum]|uniref:scavenger receptor cysteine-rich domain-containing protein DMBT1-like n=1 Tax=Diadema antillarum TaxID=105358 RepID=UPI003A86ED9A